MSTSYPSVKPPIPRPRFSLNTAGEAYEVIDQDGRPVTTPRPFAEAVIARDLLNYQAPRGVSICAAMGVAEGA